MRSSVSFMALIVWLVRGDGRRLKRRPEESGQLPRDRHDDRGRRFVVFPQAAEAPAQSLRRAACAACGRGTLKRPVNVR
jgi:hypothetical protein